MRTFKDRIARLEAAISAPSYSTASEQADAMLRIIRSGRNAEERVMLMEHLLGNFGLLIREVRGEPPKGVGVSDELFAAISARILQPLSTLGRTLQEQRAPRRTVAERLLAFFDSLADDGEQAVALAVILKSPLVPYGEVSRDLTANTFHELEEARQRPAVLASGAKIVQLLRLEVTVREVATGIERILALHQDPREVQALLCTTIFEIRRLLAEREAAGPLVGIGVISLPRELGEALRESLPEALRAHLKERGGGSCGDENCPFHGAAVRQAKEKKEKEKSN